MFKSIVISACAVIACAAAQNDLSVSFSSPGPDYYADGKTVVADGECYALVWTKAGVEFAGIAADGTAVDAENSEIVLIVPLAKNGGCPTVSFEIDAALKSKYEGGEFAIYLLDTRDVSGNVLGVDSSGKVRAVNGYGAVAGFAEMHSSSPSVASCAPQGASAVSGSGVTSASAVPATAPQPVITKIDTKGGYLYVTVSNTVPYLQYNISRGDAPSSIGAKNADVNVAEPAQGVAGSEVILVTPMSGSSGFFRVKRN